MFFLLLRSVSFYEALVLEFTWGGCLEHTITLINQNYSGNAFFFEEQKFTILLCRLIKIKFIIILLMYFKL